MDNLTTIMNRNGSDKGSGHHNYTIYYEKLFSSIRNNVTNVLEFGIGSMNPNILSNMAGTPGGYVPGSSLRGWREYFPNAIIHGCDIDRDILFKADRIDTFYCDQTDLRTLNVITEVKYDVIVDDGLHEFPVNWNVLKKTFSSLKHGGYYIIEDIDRKYENYIQYISRFDPFMNGIEWRYIPIPNPKNGTDNNIAVARHKGFSIPDCS